MAILTQAKVDGAFDTFDKKGSKSQTDMERKDCKDLTQIQLYLLNNIARENDIYFMAQARVDLYV